MASRLRLCLRLDLRRRWSWGVPRDEGLTDAPEPPARARARGAAGRHRVSCESVGPSDASHLHTAGVPPQVWRRRPRRYGTLRAVRWARAAAALGHRGRRRKAGLGPLRTYSLRLRRRDCARTLGRCGLVGAAVLSWRGAAMMRGLREIVVTIHCYPDSCPAPSQTRAQPRGGAVVARTPIQWSELRVRAAGLPTAGGVRTICCSLFAVRRPLCAVCRA